MKDGGNEVLRITRRRTEEHRPRRVKLPGEEVSVERADADESEEGGVRGHAASHS
ncbi:MAG TPA: hypothetical protein VF621_01285 [Pyrinomonadaceae bacterium]|jgi:hypothetical protein